MFDGIINNAKGSLNMVVMFFVAGLVGMAIFQALGMGEGGFNIQDILQFGVTAAVAGFATALVMGAAKG